MRVSVTECAAPLVAAVQFKLILLVITKPLIQVAPILMVNINCAIFNREKKIIYIYIVNSS